ncbi:uncharacterized protein isoform X2 [Leptinotarsa decemlineata]|uniref:uncharacterized protein isoform X2 n=1 Tax=Leptinotarsa decemlineata TaxID=7539 RepID=UPI003D30807C
MGESIKRRKKCVWEGATRKFFEEPNKLKYQSYFATNQHTSVIRKKEKNVPTLKKGRILTGSSEFLEKFHFHFKRSHPWKLSLYKV